MNCKRVLNRGPKLETDRFVWVRVGSAIGFSVSCVGGKATGVETGRNRRVGSVLGNKPGTKQTHAGERCDCGLWFVAV